MERTVQKGDKIKVHYTGKFEDGTIFDSSEMDMHHHHHHHEDGEECNHEHELTPLEVEVGAGYVIPGFDNALLGMKVGEKKPVKIAPEDAYGQPYKEMIITVKMNQFPPTPKPEVGMDLQLTGQDGSVIPAVIVAINGDDVTIDANHPLAGKTLIFDLTLVEIA